MAETLVPKKNPALSPKRREALERLRDGGVLVAGEFNLHYIDGWQVVSQNYYWLVNHRLIRVLDPNKKSNVRGNGHVISERGLAFLAALTSDP
jgi:hypothetical protein